MGSFNTTCFVSQQTIVPGAECVIIPIQQQSTFHPVALTAPNDKSKSVLSYGIANSTCYPTAFWGYAGPLIFGSYDDYGQFNLSDTSKNKSALIQFFNHLFEKAYQTTAGENQSHDHALDFQSLYSPNNSYSFTELLTIWDTVWEVANEHRLFITSYNDAPRQLQFSVMHHCAADYLINAYSSCSDYNDQTYEQKAYFSSYISSFLERLIDVFSTKKGNATFDKHSYFAIQISGLRDFHIGQQEGAHFSNYYDNSEIVLDIIDDFFKKNPSTLTLSDSLIDQLFEILSDQIQHCYLHAGLDMFNIKLSPMVYADQDYSNECGKYFAKMVRSVSSSINKEIKEKNSY